ncbi:MAG: aspartate/glutamate racemase family protein [Deltaproteobacteria bacterium]|nr:aspartate/glutamate racemase family protein [Deltaproteobacteria bacterium]
MKRIGVFGPGGGALTVTASLCREPLAAEIIHLVDLRCNPYGNRKPEHIFRLLREALKFLKSEGCDYAVIGCNTTSTQIPRAISELAVELRPRTILGALETSARGLAQLPPQSTVLILGTRLTVQSRYFQTSLEQSRPDLQVISLALPQLAERIDAGQSEAEIRQYLREEFQALLMDNRVPDIAALCCTHFPFVSNLLTETLQECYGREISLLTQSGFILEELKRHVTIEPGSPRLTVWGTSRNAHFERVVRAQLGVSRVNVLEDWLSPAELG